MGDDLLQALWKDTLIIQRWIGVLLLHLKNKATVLVKPAWQLPNQKPNFQMYHLFPPDNLIIIKIGSYKVP